MKLTSEVIDACINLDNPEAYLSKVFTSHPDIPLMGKLVSFARLVKSDCGAVASFFSLEKEYVKSTFIGPDGTSYELKLPLQIRLK